MSVPLEGMTAGVERRLGTAALALSTGFFYPPLTQSYVGLSTRRTTQILSRVHTGGTIMASNRGVAYVKPGEVRVESIDYPKLVNPTNKKKAEHGVILKIISTNICGSDQHMVRGRTTAPAGLILGHEITGEVIEAGRDVEFIK